MSDAKEIPIPRHDFYQTATHLTLALYIKGYNAVASDVKVTFEPRAVLVSLPPLGAAQAARFAIPLAGTVVPDDCSYRVLGSKIEITLAKTAGENWTKAVGAQANASGDASTSTSAATSAPKLASPPPVPSPTTTAPAPAPTASSSSAAPTAPVPKPKPARKDWDKLAADLDDDVDPADPNAGGDAALQKLFAGIYENADADTRRAMIKSFTESGGTSLSTDWGSVAKDKVKVSPPEGMYEMKM